MTNQRLKIHKKIRYTISGTASRPRLAVYRSLNHLHAQLIDDTSSKTVASASSLKANGSLSEKAKLVGEEIAKKAKAAKITAVVFDRGGFGYRGSIKLLAEAARQAGLTI